MIIDELKNIDCYGRMSGLFLQAFQFLKEADLAALAPGRHEIQGDRLYATVEEYQTRPIQRDQWEAHRRYADIQVVLSGSETVGWAPIHSLSEQAYNGERDLAQLSGDGSLLPLVQGSFILLFPQDAHQPCRTTSHPNPVKKLVLKVLLDKQ